MPVTPERPALTLLKHRLPPIWDGNPVKWDPFEVPPIMFICRRSSRRGPDDPARCECGSTRVRLVAGGWRQPLPGETMESSRAVQGRFGRTVHVPITIPAKPMRDLTAFRCADCGVDEVWDLRDDEWWTLGPEDYGPEGSARPVEREWSGGLLDLLPEGSDE